MTRRPRLVLLDLDGTLVDSVPDLAWCLDAMLEQLGRPPVGEARARTWVGNGVRRLVCRALVGQLEGEPPEQDLAQALPLFMDLYAANTSGRSRPYPGVREGLDWLSAQGYPLACVTNKAARFTEPLLRDLDLWEYFRLTISGDTLAASKPDPLPLLHAAAHFGAPPAECLMVGDSVNDVRAARAAGFGIICVTYGYNHGNDIRDAHPDDVIDSLAELRNKLGAS